MRHWTETNPTETPDWAAPPIPRHHASNDVNARLARVEEHLQWNHHERLRDRQDSRERARDLASAIVALRDMFHEEMSPIRDMMAVRAYRKELRGILAAWGLWFGRLLLGVLIVLGTITGRLSPEQAKLFGGWLGFGPPG